MNTTGHSLIDDLNKLIDERLDDPSFSIESICQNLGISRSTLKRVVKEQTGLSPTLFIRKWRLDIARHLLQTTDLRISEVADRVGFGTSQELSRYFNEAFGVSPSDFRRQLLSPAAPLPQPTTDLVLEPTKAVATNAPVPEPRIRTHRQKTMLLGGSFLLLVLLAGGVWWWRHAQKNDTTQPVTLAVLPFHNLGPTQSQYFAEGVMEQIHSLLTYVDGLKLTSRTSAAPYVNTTKAVGQMARELGVTYLLTGQVRQAGDRVTVAVELVQALEDRTLWSQTYEGQTKDVFGFMSQTARQVSSELNRQLSRSARQRLTQMPTQNPDAYNEYLKGQYMIRDRTEAGIRGAIVNFDRAIALDTGFADAWASRAKAYLLYGSEQYGPSVENWQKAEKDVLKAIRLDPENGLAYATLACLYQLQNKWEQSLTTFPIALKFRPNDPLINYWYSISLRSAGQLEAALQYNSKAVKLDPLDPIILAGYIGTLGTAGRFNEARTALTELEKLHNKSYAYYWAKGYLYCNQQQFADALATFETGYQSYPKTPYFSTMMAYCYGRLGQTVRAQAHLDTLPDTPDNYPNRAMIYAGMGQPDRCLMYLERGAPTGRLPDYLKVARQFTFLHQNPRYLAVLRQVGLR